MKLSKQQNAFECGLHIIQSLNNHFHKTWIDINILRGESSLNQKGLSITGLIKLGLKYGVEITGFKSSFEDLIKNKKEWFIIKTETNNIGHFIIIKAEEDYIQVVDPSQGKYKLLFKEFKNIYQGIVMTIKPFQFKLDNSQKYNQSNLLSWIAKDKKIFFLITFSITFSLLFVFISSTFMKIIFDRVLPGRLNSWLTFLLIVFSLIVLMKVANTFLNKYLVKKLTLVIECKLTFLFNRKLAKTNLLELEKQSESDVLRKATILESVAFFIATSWFVVIEEIFIFIISFGLLIWISTSLFGISLIFSGFMIILTIIAHFLVSPRYQILINQTFNIFGQQSQIIKDLKKIKNNHEWNNAFNKYTRGYLKYKKTEYGIWKIFALQNIMANLLSGIGPIVITILAVKNIFQQQMTAGEMILFTMVLSLFDKAIFNLADFVLKIKQNLKNLNLIKSVLDLSVEEINYKGVIVNKIKNITIANLKFSYNKEILNIKNFKINENLIISGNNGSGKSTLLNFISLNYINGSKLKFNNLDYSFYNLESLREKIFFLNSKSAIANDSVFDAITLNHQQAIETFQNNIITYSLEKWFFDNDINLSASILDDGNNFSAGQKQIFLLLKLLAFKFDLIILDEALENISFKNLSFLKKAINDFQKNSLFIEVSHSQKYLSKGKEIKIEQINNI